MKKLVEKEDKKWLGNVARNFIEIGRKGGEKVAEERGTEFYREIGRKGGESRGNRGTAVKGGRSGQRKKTRVHK